ncbi:uncharacterized protein Z520_02534 [Fonsecaea multimorphosa CBS 102226]|uniref:Uncharacterized protein n=1 Tax=Fonsecaea multimorphosa CBS 102226 TaxID=1442371 RepID=A0A0D2HKK8_9EURO|nr:uncharacterized protein Z520_02534 [Fonsecaea multimorphosa CBS 102226]KIY02396.1 hypothetical protein Z520_02534 [Fonsecaea multimorphosa CBS 102226]
MSDDEGAAPLRQQRFVIGLDYGTTYTGVAFATPNSNHLPLDEIDLIEDWGPNMGNHKKIPSVISFSPSTDAMEQQWGSDLSENAISIIHTKLELDLQDVDGELDLMIQALDGMDNFSFDHIKGAGALHAFSDKSAEQVVTEYLSRVFEHLESAIANFSTSFRVRVPVDIVVTVPTEWSYRAKNSTFRALTNAGFNEEYFPRLASVIFITEPEAAATYTARYLKDEIQQIFLKPNSCFILCDAGGGTVDVVSYKVKQVEPSLVLERIGVPTGDKCGAIYIDIAFKEWLRQMLGNKYYEKLDQNHDLQRISSHTCESKAMRQLMKSFDVLKKGFHKNNRDMALDLPPPLHNLTLDNRVDCGEIKITSATMTGFFNACVETIMNLLQGHIRQIENVNKQCRNIFLVGGFGESPYLQEEIEFSLSLRRIKLRRPDTSWTAVVRGAVLHGIEKDTISNLCLATKCPRHFGISLSEQFSRIHHEERHVTINPITKAQIVEGQLLWMLNKGDLVLSDSPTAVSQMISLSFREADKTAQKLTVYSYSDDEDRPSRIKNSLDDLEVSHVLEYDLAKIDRKRLESSKGRIGKFYVAKLKLTLSLSAHRLDSILSWEETELATGEQTW